MVWFVKVPKKQFELTIICERVIYADKLTTTQAKSGELYWASFSLLNVSSRLHTDHTTSSHFEIKCYTS